jgi:hypothetical protein
VHRVFFGHHKCASRFFRLAVFAPLARANGWDVVSYRIDSPPFHFSDLPDLDLQAVDFERLKSSVPAVVNLLNASPAVLGAVVSTGCEFRGLRVIRDPRQVLVSAYFHHRGGHPVNGSAGFVWDKLGTDKAILRELPVEDGILYELDNITGQVIERQILAWQSDPRVMEIRVEDIATDREGFLRRLSGHLQVSLPAIDWSRSFSDSGAKHWSEHFTPRVKSAFKERYGDALIRLGYAQDLDW